MDKFDLIKKEIDKLTKDVPYEIEYSHSQSVLKWILKLKPNADVALKIAAIGHDIDRSIPERRIRAEDFNNYNKYKKQHSLRSSEIISELMKKFNFNKEIIEKTQLLIENHEVGGKGNVEILKEADSLSFFENNLEHYIKTNPKYVKDKIKFMYKRLSEKAKKLVLEEITFKNKKIKKIVKETIANID